jgi:hypothetical protein
MHLTATQSMCSPGNVPLLLLPLLPPLCTHHAVICDEQEAA